MFRISCLFGILLLCTTLLFAQSPSPDYIPLRPNATLPSPVNVRGFFEDSLGYVWIGSRSEFTRYDGSNYHEFARWKYPDRQVTRMLSGPKGQPTYLSESGQFYFTEADTLRPYPHNAAIKRDLQEYMSGSLRFDSKGYLHVGSLTKGYYRVNPAGEVDTLCGRNFAKKGLIVSLFAGAPPVIFCNSYPPTEQDSIYITDEQFRVLAALPNNATDFSHRPTVIQDHADGIYFTNGNGKLVHWSPTKGSSEINYPFVLTDLLLDRQNTLWAGSVDQGVHFFANGTLSPTHERVMFEGQKAAVSLEDAAGGLWVRTDEKSYHIPLPYMLKSSKENKTLPASGIYCSENFGDSIFLAIDPLGLYRMKGNVVDAVPAPIFETRNQKRITKILAHPDSNQLWITGIGEFAIRQSDGRWSLVELPEDTKSQAITEMCYIGNDRMLIITPRKFFIYRGEELLQVSNEFSERLMGVCKGPGDSFFIASHGGVYRQDPDSLYNLGDEYPLLGEACVDVFYRRGRLFVTRNYGPLTLLENGKVLEFEDEEEIWIEGLIFFEWNERSIGMMGQLGLTIIEDGVPNGDSIRLHHHPMSEGSGKININSFRAHQGKVYIASLEGLYAVDTADLLNPHHLPKVVVQEMAINGRDTAILPHYELSHDQNTFRLRYAAISYGNYKIRAGFEYKMVGLDEDWQTYTNDFILQYTTLPPGEYELNIRARMGYYIWSEPCKVRFTIAPPFWATWWFLTLMGALLILLIWLLIRYRTRQALKAEKLRSEMALELSELEMRALKAQLNPHFIFNSIGSVHHYLRNNSPDEAARYLERFSRVMRQILEHSDSKEISLEEELELLQNYIRLESERLDHSPIQLEIDSKGMDLKEILLPPALFQPYIENAIWHGLRPKKSDRKLQILLSKEAEALRIEIRDNGIGRQASKKSGNTQRAHRSFGMRIASGRLRHLNHSEESPIEILDLTDPEGEAIGTSVRLSIPYKRKVA